MMRRRTGMSFEEFTRYWREVHAGYVAQIPEITRYTQRHIIPSDEEPNPFGIDGFVILEYESPAAKVAAWSGELGKAAKTDADNFRVHQGRIQFEDFVVVDRTGEGRG